MLACCTVYHSNKLVANGSMKRTQKHRNSTTKKNILPPGKLRNQRIKRHIQKSSILIT